MLNHYPSNYMTSMVQRIRELAVQAGDPAYTSNDRAMLQLEVDQLKQEIDRVSSILIAS